jgi:hypothetical protein
VCADEVFVVVMTAVSGRKGTWPWPGVEELLFLKLVSVIFPTTGASYYCY